MIVLHYIIEFIRKPQMIKSLPLVVLLIVLSSSTLQDRLTPIQMFSIKVTGVEIVEKGENKGIGDFLVLKHKLQSDSKKIKNADIIGSISDLDLVQDPGLQFYFNYTLDKGSCQVSITIYTNSLLEKKKISPHLQIVLDFMVADFPTDYVIHFTNMTGYQEHWMYDLDDYRKYQLITLLNGFSNISLSGNITHTYAGSVMFVIHYLTDLGEEVQMGWQNNHDFLMFTLVLVRREHLVQKFYLQDPTFFAQYPPNMKYFYGIKGSSDEKIICSFQDKSKGVSFKATKNPKFLYGLIFLPYVEDRSLVDFRVHEKEEEIKTNSIWFILAIIIVIAVFIGFRIKYQSDLKRGMVSSVAVGQNSDDERNKRSITEQQMRPSQDERTDNPDMEGSLEEQAQNQVYPGN